MKSGTLDWHSLVQAAGRQIYPSMSVRDLYRRFKFWRAWRRHREVLQGLVGRDGNGTLVHAMKRRPRVLGMVVWPYINKDWSVHQRFSRFAEHYWLTERHQALDLDVDDAITLADLHDVHPGLQVVLDRPQWFLREGELSINLFLSGERLYSLAFSLGQADGFDAAYVGGIQGRNIEGVEATYKEMTKKLHGTRPRDFLVGVFQLLCEDQGISKILAVSDDYRHHRHQYFGHKADKTQAANYDAIWRDRGGSAVEGGFFELPARVTFKDDTDIPAHKRSQYRRRYALYDRVRADLQRALTRL